MKRKFILSHHRSPGDLVCLTALMRDIHLTYPGEFETDFNTTVTPVWANSPYITRLWNHNHSRPAVTSPGAKMITCQYNQGLKDQNKESIHFCGYFHRDFEKQTGIRVPLHLPHGDLHLSPAEIATPPVKGRYWLMLTGGKSDFTIKVWHTKYFQEVADQLQGLGLGVVQTGADFKTHWHPKLTGEHVIDLCGWGGFREFVRQIYHAEGVICGVTAAMHIAAALHKPCVVVAGGREAWWWEAYVSQNTGLGEARHKLQVPHRFLHTIGLLDCCKHHGCWRNKVVPLGGDPSICLQPIHTPEMPIARCMQIITPEHVMDAVKSYYTDHSLPPITPAAGEITLQVVPSPPTCSLPAGDKQRVRTSASVTIPAGVPLKINPTARVHTRTQAGPDRPGQSIAFPDSVLDHPAVGGKLTFFVLFYGDFFELHKKCLTSLLATVPGKRMDLRVGSNALCQQSLDMIEGYVSQGVITKHYRHENNDYKYPVMREMFRDPDCPIETKWLVWFDDDSICDVEQDWVNILGTHIAQHHKDRAAHMIGATFVWSPTAKQREIFAARPWHTGKPWRNAQGQPSPNGQKIIFAAGGFWAITTEAMLAADIPDLGTGLTHTGGDWQIGEQLYQSGYGLKQFNGKKQFVRTSSVPRRGVTMPTVDQVGKLPPPQPVTQPPPRQEIHVPRIPEQPKVLVPQPRLRKLINL